MELLPLPNFYHNYLLVLFFGFIFIFIIVISKSKRQKNLYKPKLKNKEDLYKFSIVLQKIAPNDKEVKKFLKKIEFYKYQKESKKIPHNIKKEALELYKRKKKHQVKIID
ncbi:hypothetical protein [Nitrosophilus labii]|uniref:hypothetical protein n=1 Tax=Nitrosophilus labii TaxID=2706014 RepID=UPI0016574F69|nr:hypothetical protein [Nitrosophilus labii]